MYVIRYADREIGRRGGRDRGVRQSKIRLDVHRERQRDDRHKYTARQRKKFQKVRQSKKEG
jgi:hypothetical protein